MQIPIKVISTDAFAIQTDVLVLKYAQGLYGLDKKAVGHMSPLYPGLETRLPKTGDFALFEKPGPFGARQILFVGVERLPLFRYQNVREFARRALAYLAQAVPQAENVSFTVHGVNFGLDEAESFKAEIAGLVDALTHGEYPQTLREITIVEFDKERAERLKQILSELLPQGTVETSRSALTKGIAPTSDSLRDAGYSSEKKPIVFVAMPFDKKMYDIFHYGIRGAVNNAGYLCERADEAFFTGDIMERVKMQIKGADLIVADLTQSNANVYLEVGYAWGCSKPTILLAQDASELKFDVKGQRCLIYTGIKELEELLTKELQNLPLKK